MEILSKFSLFGFLFLIAGSLCGQNDPANQIRNAGFEDNDRDLRSPVDWNTSPPLKLGILEGAFVDSRRGHTGRHSLCLNPGIAERGGEREKTVAAEQKLKVKGKKTVVFGFWTLRSAEAGPMTWQCEVWTGERKLLTNMTLAGRFADGKSETWVRHQETVELPQQAYRIRLILSATGPGPRWIDDVLWRPAGDDD